VSVLFFQLALAATPPAQGPADVFAAEARPGVSVPGLPMVPVGTEPIINGEPYEKQDWPETGALVVKLGIQYGAQTFDFITPICSSTLIAPDVVLLAAHCVDEQVLALSAPGADIQEFAWDRKANLTSYLFGAGYNPGVTVASEAVMHPDFDIRNFNSWSALGVSRNDDIALLFLSEAVEDAPFAYLPTAEEAEQIVVDNEVHIVGWGQRSASDPYSSGVKYGGISHINELGRHEFQVGGVEQDVRKCHGDSGGPSFMEVETDSAATFRLIGVTSHAYDLTDCYTTGGVDTRVDAYLDWIEEEMVAACDAGTRAWCDWPGIIPPPDADGYHAWEVNPNEPLDPFGNAGGEDAASETAADSEAKGGCSTSASSAGVAGALVGLGGLLGRRR